MKVDHTLRHRIMDRIPPRQFFTCYQCGECTSSCPVFQEEPEKFNPRKILQMAALGLRELIEGEMIWRCTTCYECVENCPQGINFVDLLVVLRNIAVENGYVPREVIRERDAVIRSGYILPISSRIKKIREEAGLPTLDSESLRKELEILKGEQRTESLVEGRA